MINRDQGTSRSQVTRQDRAIYNDAWITEFLHNSAIGVLATSIDGQPFTCTLLFVYAQDRHAIYLHKARRGRVWENLTINPAVCLTVSEMGRLLPAPTALNFSVEFESVVVFGTARLVDDPVEAEFGLQCILDKYFPHLHPGTDYRPITEDERQVTAVYRIDIEEWSGKRKAAAEDFPGAFFWKDKPSR